MIKTCKPDIYQWQPYRVPWWRRRIVVHRWIEDDRVCWKSATPGDIIERKRQFGWDDYVWVYREKGSESEYPD